MAARLNRRLNRLGFSKLNHSHAKNKVGTGFRKTSCSIKRLERGDDSKRSHPAIGFLADVVMPAEAGIQQSEAFRFSTQGTEYSIARLRGAKTKFVFADE